MSADGAFVIAWHNPVQDGNQHGVYARRYDALGRPQGDEFQVNTFIKDSQVYPAAAMDADGDFVIAWESQGQDGSRSGVFGQRFNAEGVRLGDCGRAAGRTCIANAPGTTGETRLIHKDYSNNTGNTVGWVPAPTRDTPR